MMILSKPRAPRLAARGPYAVAQLRNASIRLLEAEEKRLWIRSHALSLFFLGWHQTKLLSGLELEQVKDHNNLTRRECTLTYSNGTSIVLRTVPNGRLPFWVPL